MLTIAPPPASIIGGMAYFAIITIEVTLTRMARSKASGSTSIALPGGPVTPTLLIRMLTPPNASSARSTACWHDSGLRDVRLHQDRLAAVTLDQVERPLGPLAPLVQQHDLGALARQHDGGGAAVADDRAVRAGRPRSGAGDDGDLAGQPLGLGQARIARERLRVGLSRRHLVTPPLLSSGTACGMQRGPCRRMGGRVPRTVPIGYRFCPRPVPALHACVNDRWHG